jgi:hypothetical protein
MTLETSVVDVTSTVTASLTQYQIGDSMKVSDLIKALEIVKKEYGNLDVLFSKDPEGNAYADLGKRLNIDILNKTLLVFPERQIYADELETKTAVR